MKTTNPPIHPKRFWILGAGRFGQIAVERITRRFPAAFLTVVDKMRPKAESKANLTLVQEDGIEWLKDNLDRNAPVDMIVPAIPVHVAAQWLKIKLAGRCEVHPARIPEEWLARVPHPVPGHAGQVWISHADFVCPDNCPEPETICTHTGRPRPPALYRLLQDLDAQDCVRLVLRSHQLLPGVGILCPADLLRALSLASALGHGSLMIGTACRCHGIVDFMHLA